MKHKILLACFLLLYGTVIINAQENSELSYAGVGKTIDMNKLPQFYPLLGYTVLFPEKLGKDYSIRDVSFGLGLSKGITEEVSRKLEEAMFNAIEDNTIFKSLTEYGPYRTMGAIYSNADETSVIVVATIPTAMYRIVEVPGDSEDFFKEKKISFNKFMIENIKCYWIEYNKTFNESPSFNWDMNSVTYMIFSIKGKFLLMDGAADIAKKFIEFNKSGPKK